MKTIYEHIDGYNNILSLAMAWHVRVMADEVVSHAFSHGFHRQHTERLAAYWAEALGGRTRYSDLYGGESDVVRMHSGNGPHEEMDRRAIACFDEAVGDVGLAGDDRLSTVLHDYFEWATTNSMSRYHQSEADVPDGLTIPHWSWNGLVGEKPRSTTARSRCSRTLCGPSPRLHAVNSGSEVPIDVVAVSVASYSGDPDAFAAHSANAKGIARRRA